MITTRRILLAAPFLAMPALAQPARGPNGGQVVVDHGHPIELVVAGTALTIHFGDEGGRPIPSRGASGRVVVQAGGRTVNLTLQPAEPNRLTGTLPAPLAAGGRVVFTGQMADGHRVSARFVIE